MHRNGHIFKSIKGILGIDAVVRKNRLCRFLSCHIQIPHDSKCDVISQIRFIVSHFCFNYKQSFVILRRNENRAVGTYGGGGYLVRNFGSYDRNRVIINDDICATVKGYERWAEHQLSKADSDEH